MLNWASNTVTPLNEAAVSFNYERIVILLQQTFPSAA